ncbi:MAG: bifunctional methylenetetrahydrofolate dehydrogenase/methenyltetrahydrofolate cyclohydrolase FolD [Rhodospirillales bacterium]
MSARIIDGKSIAAALRARVADEVARLPTPPGLAVVLVGEDPASAVYVRNKGIATRETGMRSIEHRLPAETGQAELLALIARLNGDPEIDGILVQLPLPGHVDAQAIVAAIDPAKDVDGFHVFNAGLLATGGAALVPCTPRGCMILLRESGIAIAGAEAVVVGRSNIVGKPVAQLLLAADATVTVAHSRTRDLPAVCRRADIVIAAVGRPEMLRGGWIKPGAAVIDVGINRVGAAGGKFRLVGDVAYDETAAVAGAITPVPGGVGPMTIACLLENTLIAARRRRGWKG